MEEQALDLSDETQKAAMLAEALCLHKAALSHYQRRFGDENVHTAKNYGNIGRLYQSMGLYEVSIIFCLQFDKPIRCRQMESCLN